MSAKQRSPLYHWEQEMIDAYHDYQWHFALKLERRRSFTCAHGSRDPRNAQIRQKLYTLFTSKRDFLVDVIQVNKDWFPRWLHDHPKPEA